jgi:hypothetical protein
MEVIVEVPDDIARQLGEASQMPRQMLEAYAAETYRAQKISRAQLRRLLGLDYWQAEEFLNLHDARRSYTVEDLQTDRQSLASLPKK